MANLIQSSLASLGGVDIQSLAKDPRDPQTVFYLNPVYASEKDNAAVNDAKEALQDTIYSWAPKIERTVQEKLPKDHNLQASWDRASFRAKLVDALAKQTPWLAMTGNTTASPVDKSLTGDYGKDKLMFQNLIDGHVNSQLHDIPTNHLSIISNLIAETMVLSRTSLAKTQRFAIVLPWAKANEATMKVLIFNFEQKEENGKVDVETTRSFYSAKLNLSGFQDEKLDQKELALGKGLVQDATMDIVV